MIRLQKIGFRHLLTPFLKILENNRLKKTRGEGETSWNFSCLFLSRYLCVCFKKNWFCFFSVVSCRRRCRQFRWKEYQCSIRYNSIKAMHIFVFNSCNMTLSWLFVLCCEKINEKQKLQKKEATTNKLINNKKTKNIIYQSIFLKK